MKTLSFLYPEIVISLFFGAFFIYTLLKEVSFRSFFLNIIKKVILSERLKTLEEKKIEKEFLLKDRVVSFVYELKKQISIEKNLNSELITKTEKIFLIYSSFLCFFGMILYLVLFFNKTYYQEFPGQELSFFLNYTILVDPFSLFLKALIMLLGFIYFIITYITSKYWKFYGMEFGFLIFIILFSMLLLASSMDFFFIFLSIELQSLSIVLLTAFQVTQKRSIEAGLKYFILSAFFSGIYLLGVSLIYFTVGTVNFMLVYELSFGGTLGSEVKDQLFNLGILLIASTLLFKLGLIPFYFWSPDVYQGANILVTAFIAIVSKIGLIAVFIRIFFSVFVNFTYVFEDIFYFIGLLSMLIGAILAFYQTDIKRFLAYSSMSNIGYLFLAMSIGTHDAIVYGLFYFVTYIFGTFAFFLILIGLVKKEKIDGNLKNILFTNDLHDFKFLVTINDFEGLYKNNKIISSILMVILFNLIGVPPFTFFFGKLFLFDLCLANNFYLAIVILILTSFVSAFYYLRIIRVMFLNRNSVSKLFCFSSLIFGFIVICLVVLMIISLFTPMGMSFLMELLQKIFLH